MNDDTLEQVESQLSALQTVGAPSALRRAVMSDVRRELGAARWDRRLASLAAVFVAVGVGMNAAILWQPVQIERGSAHVFATNPRSALAETATAIAEATDAHTGRQYARQLAALMGHTLSRDEAAAIDAAVHPTSQQVTHGTKG